MDDDFPGTDEASVTYSPAGSWYEGQTCASCIAQPDKNTVYNGTWHHTTDDSTIDTQDTIMTIQFTGTAVYVYCVIANSISVNAGTTANYDFTLDGEGAGTYHHDEENTTSYYYNVPVFAVTDLDNTSHELVVNVNGGAGVVGSSLMLFDYFTYTHEDEGPRSSSVAPSSTASTSETAQADSTKSSNIGAIVGGVVGGVGGIAVLGALLFFFMRRRKNNNSGFIDSSDEHESSKNYVTAVPYTTPYQDTPLATPAMDMTAAPRKSRLPVSVAYSPPSDAISSWAPSPSATSASRSSKAQMELDMRVRDMEAQYTTLQDETHHVGPAEGSSSSPMEEALRRQMEEMQAEIASLRHQQQEMLHERSAPPPGYNDV